MNRPLTLTEVNALPLNDFVRHFGGVLEHSPRYAERVGQQRPFGSVEELAAAFTAAVLADTPGQQLALICAHPDLAGKAALAGEVTPESASEQASAGLDRLSPEEYAERLEAVWSTLLRTSDFAARLEEVQAFNAAHPHVKRGLAITPVKFGISFNFTAYNQAGALVHVYKDGSVLINHGGTEMGQGLHTKMLQVAATALGVPLSCVRLAPTRTDKVPNTSATAASSGADLNGGAIKDACEQIKARLAAVAAGRFGVYVHPNDVRFENGWVYPLGHPDRGMSFAQLAHDAYHARTQLWAAGYYRTPGLHWDREAMQGEPFKYFAYGASVSEVEVDGFTGAYRLRRVDILHDVGDSLSPLIDRGQVEGGFVQGAGWLTLEDLRWDTSPGPNRGRLATQAASTYKLPSFSEMPEVFNVALLERAAESGVVYGSKAVGEPPLMLALSVREALRQAAAAFGPEGRETFLPSPATPEAVFWALDAARQAAMRPEVAAD